MTMKTRLLLAPRASTRYRWIAARVLVCAGALLFAIASWLPWWRITIVFSGMGGQAFSLEVPATALPVLLYVRLSPTHTLDSQTLASVLGLLWYGMLSGGALVALALWQRASARLSVVAKRVFRAWLFVSTALALLAVWVFFGTASDSWVQPSDGVHAVRDGMGAGLWLALAALALLWIGMLLMAGEPRIQARVAFPNWRRSRVQRLGLAAVVAGGALWCLGYNALPWATVNCPTTRLSLFHFVDGACAGVDSGDTFMAVVMPHLRQEQISYALDALVLLDVLLIGCALLLAIGAARRTSTRALCGWMLAWLLAATGLALLSYRGVAAVVAHPPILSSAAIGTWHADAGVVITFAGLLCSWASLIPLEAAAIAHTQPAGPSPAAEPVATPALEP